MPGFCLQGWVWAFHKKHHAHRSSPASCGKRRGRARGGDWYFLYQHWQGISGSLFLHTDAEPSHHAQPDPVQEVAVDDVVAVGPGSLDTYEGLELEVSPNSQRERALLDQSWHTAAAEETVKVLVKDIVTPILIEMILGSGDEHEIDVDNPTETAIEDAVDSLPDVAADLAKHDIQAAAIGFINDFKKNLAGIQAKVFAAISRKLVSSGFLTAADLEDSLIRLEQAETIIELLNWGLVTVDVSRSEYDNTAYHTADLWTANVLRPKVTLSPNPATVNDIQNIATLTAQVQANPIPQLPVPVEHLGDRREPGRTSFLDPYARRPYRIQ